MKKILRTLALAAVVGASLLVTDASATRTPEQTVGLSASFRLQLQAHADASDDAGVDATIANAITVLETEQNSASQTVKKAANEFKKLDKALEGNSTYDGQAEFVVGLYAIVMGSCGLEANLAIFNGKGSLIAKSKRIEANSRAFTKAGEFAADTTKPRFKRLKKIGSMIKRAEKLVK